MGWTVARSKGAMGTTWWGAILLAVGMGAGCAGLAPSEGEPAPEAPDEAEAPEAGADPEDESPRAEAEALDLRPAVVTALDPGGGLEAGDSVAVELERTPPLGARGIVHGPEGAAGASFSATELGPLPGEEGWVTTETVNVRACPGTGCEVVGSLRLGQTAEVHDVEDGWYALDADGTRWVRADFLTIEEGWSAILGEMVASPFQAFWEDHLAGRTPEEGVDEGPLFEAWHLGVREGSLRVVLSSNYNAGPGGHEVCQWAHSSAEVLEGIAAQLAAYGVTGHDVDVYYRGDEDQPVARLDDQGEVVCILR